MDCGDFFCHTDVRKCLTCLKNYYFCFYNLYAMQNFLQDTGYHTYYVYILTNKHRTTFYIGVTNNLSIRLQQHLDSIQANNVSSFVGRYQLGYLVFYEKFTWIQDAIAREKELKGWRRDKKIDLIRGFNSNFEFLNDRFL